MSTLDTEYPPLGGTDPKYTVTLSEAEVRAIMSIPRFVARVSWEYSITAYYEHHYNTLHNLKCKLEGILNGE